MAFSCAVTSQWFNAEALSFFTYCSNWRCSYGSLSHYCSVACGNCSAMCESCSSQYNQNVWTIISLFGEHAHMWCKIMTESICNVLKIYVTRCNHNVSVSSCFRSLIVVAFASIRLQWPNSPESFYSFKKLLAYADLFCPSRFYAANLLSNAAVTVCGGYRDLGIRLPIWMLIGCRYAQCNYARRIVTYRKQTKPVH